MCVAFVLTVELVEVGVALVMAEVIVEAVFWIAWDSDSVAVELIVEEVVSCVL